MSRQGMSQYALEILSLDAKTGGPEHVLPQLSKIFGEMFNLDFTAQAQREEMLEDDIVASSAAES